MDNAIEAAKECNEKIINVCMRKDAKASRQILLIENTYKDKKIDTEKIYEKGYTSKKSNTRPRLMGNKTNLEKKR